LIEDLEKITYIENIIDEKERIINLINFASNCSSDENKKIKNEFDEKYKQIETLGSKIHKSTEQHTITSSDDETTDEEHPGRNRLKNIIKKSKLKNGIKPANTECTTTTTTSSSDDDKTGETDDEEIEILKNNDDSNLKNNDDSNLKNNDENENNNDDENNNNNVEIDENKLKKEAFNKKRREQRMARILKKKEDEQNKNKIEISFN
jgi:hypothetical protein